MIPEFDVRKETRKQITYWIKNHVGTLHEKFEEQINKKRQPFQRLNTHFPTSYLEIQQRLRSKILIVNQYKGLFHVLTIDGWQSPIEVSLQDAIITIPFLNNTYQIFSSSLKELPDGCAPTHTKFIELKVIIGQKTIN